MKEEEILKNIGLVYKAIQYMNFQQRNDDEEWDEIYITGIIGLIKAVNTYNESIAKKSTYYFQCILNEIRKLYTARTSQKRNKLPISLESYISSTDILFEETLQSEQNIEEEYILKEQIEIMLSTLERYKNKKHLAMVKDNFGIGCERLSIRAIAKKYGMSTQNAFEVRKKVLNWLRKELGGLNE